MGDLGDVAALSDVDRLALGDADFKRMTSKGLPTVLAIEDEPAMFALANLHSRKAVRRHTGQASRWERR